MFELNKTLFPLCLPRFKTRAMGVCLSLCVAVTACSTAGPGLDNALYRYQCSDGQPLYMSVEDDYSGLVKYEGRALRFRGVETINGAKFKTSDNRMVLYMDGNDSLTIHKYQQGTVMCSITGTHEPDA